MDQKKPKKRATGGGRKARTPGEPRNVLIQVVVTQADADIIDGKLGKKTRSTFLYDIIKRAIMRKS